MQLRVFTLRLDPETGAFDDAALQTFVADRTVLSVTDHFFHDAGAPVWALLVSYREDGPFATATAARRPSRRGENPAADLSAEERTLFDALRSWRGDRAQAEGKPPYILFTNRHLAAIAKARPSSKAALEQVPGVGANRLRDYGPAVLEVIASIPSAKADEVSRDEASTGKAPDLSGGADA